MKPDSETQARIESASFNANLFRVLQSAGVIIGVFGILLGPIWTFGIQPHLQQLNARVEKVELQLFDMQRQQTALDKNLAVMVEKITAMESNVREIKNTLNRRN